MLFSSDGFPGRPLSYQGLERPASPVVKGMVGDRLRLRQFLALQALPLGCVGGRSGAGWPQGILSGLAAVGGGPVRVGEPSSVQVG